MRTQISLAFALVSAFCVAFSAQAQNASFKNWTVLCDDTGYCEASTPDTNHVAGLLRIGRLAVPGAVWEISVELKSSDETTMRPTRLRIAGQRTTRLSPNRDFANFGNPNRYHLINSASLQPLFRRMIESRRIFATFSDGTTARLDASYSLNGLSASLLFIDDMQNQLGTVRVAGPPNGPRLSSTPNKTEQTTPATDVTKAAETLHEQIKDRDDCDAQGGESYALGTVAHPLDDKQSVVLIPCSVHAYNTTFNLYLVEHETQQAERLSWAVYSGFTGWIATDRLSNVNFDTESGKLSMVHKGRGIGDCGMAGTWKWEEFAFKMVSFQAKDDCDGKDSVWPQIFPLE